MSDYITTVALINGEPATVSFTREFVESLFPEASVLKPAQPEIPATLQQLAEQYRAEARN